MSHSLTSSPPFTVIRLKFLLLYSFPFSSSIISFLLSSIRLSHLLPFIRFYFPPSPLLPHFTLSCQSSLLPLSSPPISLFIDNSLSSSISSLLSYLPFLFCLTSSFLPVFLLLHLSPSSFLFSILGSSFRLFLWASNFASSSFHFLSSLHHSHSALLPFFDLLSLHVLKLYLSSYLALASFLSFLPILNFLLTSSPVLSLPSFLSISIYHPPPLPFSHLSFASICLIW